MKRVCSLALIAGLVLLSGCKKKHPSEITLNPEFNPNDVGAVLVSPVISTLTDSEDPNRQADIIMNRLIWEHVSQRPDYTFLSPESFRFAARNAGLTGRIDEYKAHWAKEEALDAEFLRGIRENANADIMLIPLIFLWNKDEADYREEGSASTTQVGATFWLVDLETGEILWKAIDENFKESVRTEGQREAATTGTITRRISGVSETGRDIYSAPPFEDVAVMVVEILVNAIPEKGAIR